MTQTQTAPFQFPKPLHKPYRNLPIPFPKPLPCSSFSFPCKPFSTRELPLRFHPLKDSSDDYLLEELENPGAFQRKLGNLMEFDAPGMSKTRILDGESSRRIFVPNPPWLEAIYLRGVDKLERREVKVRFRDMERAKYNALRRRQVKEETEAWQQMLDEYNGLVEEMCEKKLAPNLPYVKNLFLGWFEPFKEAIEKEQKRPKSKTKDAFSPNIEMLPADKLAVIVMYKMMVLLMMSDSCGSVHFSYAACQIGKAVEQEVRMQSFLKKAKIRRKKNASDAEVSLQNEKEMLGRRIKGLITRNKLAHLQKLIKSEETESWGQSTQAKLGGRLIHLLVETAYVQLSVDQSIDSTPVIRPAFMHSIKITKNPGQMTPRRYGVIECDPLVLSGLEASAMHMVIPYSPMLVPPQKWKGYDKGGHLFLPSYVMRTHGSRKQRNLLKSTPERNMKKVFEALDTLGNTKWRVNQRVLDVVETLWEKGGNVAGLVERRDVLIPEVPLSQDPLEIQQWKWSVWKARKTNSERHSLRCDTELKLSVARKLKDESCFYYPHNLDFRGRAYPMHPHLNHLGSDVCRGILEFAEGKPLGVSGLRWLKIQIANLYAGGVEKLSHEGRLAFVEDHLDDIFDSAHNPINGKCWWLTAEDPFQCLAACINLSEALRSSSPTTVICRLPIHQDGSCNGLQHYAALGRNIPEAAAVNLVAGEKPADVYSEIATRVKEIIIRDSNKDISTCPDAFIAKQLIDQVDRKLVKQTVMTSVYGVTFVGAREQIKRRLQEKGHITDEKLLYLASIYAAKVTLTALGELFGSARDIMGWLGNCAKVIASDGQSVQWTTPLGLPVVQPYYKRENLSVNTSLQNLSLRREGSTVAARRQKTAFSPNFIHSLDGTHMMMTAIACRDAGLYFAGVHDSFWTHACDVDLMNRILREKFVELYRGPILENLLENFQKLHPDLDFPPLPRRGNFDLHEVLKSPYFFN